MCDWVDSSAYDWLRPRRTSKDIRKYLKESRERLVKNCCCSKCIGKALVDDKRLDYKARSPLYNDNLLILGFIQENPVVITPCTPTCSCLNLALDLHFRLSNID